MSLNNSPLFPIANFLVPRSAGFCLVLIFLTDITIFRKNLAAVDVGFLCVSSFQLHSSELSPRLNSHRRTTSFSPSLLFHLFRFLSKTCTTSSRTALLPQLHLLRTAQLRCCLDSTKTKHICTIEKNG